jgi:hypothetical protein
MRQGTGYAYGDSEEWIISYKCEGCGKRMQVTPAQARSFRGAVTACSRLCVLKAHELRIEQRPLVMDMPEPAARVAMELEVRETQVGKGGVPPLASS